MASMTAVTASSRIAARQVVVPPVARSTAYATWTTKLMGSASSASNDTQATAPIVLMACATAVVHPKPTGAESTTMPRSAP